MTLAVLADRVKEATRVEGTGSVPLLGPYTSYQAFSVGIGVGNQTFYGIADPENNAWETGHGTLVSSSLFTRDVVYESSNNNTFVNFGSSRKSIFVPAPAARSVIYPLDSYFLQLSGSTAISGNLVVLGSASISDGISGLVSASNILHGTMSGDFFISGNVSIPGTASVGVLTTIYTTSSIIYTSGSTIWGNSLDDTHQITGSLLITGSISVRTTTGVASIMVKQNASADGYLTEASGNDSLLLMYANGTQAVIASTYQATAGFKPLVFRTGGVDRVSIDTSGNLIAAADNAYDIGAAGANRFRNLYLAGAASLQAVTATTGDFSGRITSTVSNNIVVLANGSTTGVAYSRYVNSAGDLFYGIEGSAGGVLGTGTNPYYAVFGQNAPYGVDFITAGVRRGGFSATGAFDLTNGLTVSAGITALQAVTATTIGATADIISQNDNAAIYLKNGTPASVGGIFTDLRWASGLKTDVAIGSLGKLKLYSNNSATASIVLDAGTVTIANGLTVSAGIIAHAASNASPTAIVIGPSVAASTLYSTWASQNNRAIEINANGTAGGATLVLSQTDNTSGNLLGSLSFVAAGTSAADKRGFAIVAGATGSQATAPNAYGAFYGNSGSGLGEWGRMIGGVLAWGTTCTTGAGAGNIVLPNSTSYGAVNVAGTSVLGLLFADSSNRLALNLQSAALALVNASTATSATAGGASALPATPDGYLFVNIGGANKKIPYYA